MSDDATQPMFRGEYEQELEAWLRRRVGYLCIVYIVVELLALLLVVAGMWVASERQRYVPMWLPARAIALAGTCVSLGIVAYAYFVQRPRMEGRQEGLSLVTRMILALGTVSILGRVIVQWIAPAVADGMTESVLWALFLWHFSACLFLPWTPRESLRAVVPLLAGWDLYLVLTQLADHPVGVILSIIFNPGVLIPGLALCAWRLRRHSREFRAAMVGRHFMSMRRELTHARRLHESMFPAPYDDGFLRFEFTYAPMRELGGDFVHLHVGGEGMLHLTLVDVTGHGLAAALTVSRLYGELERIRAESAQAQPEEVIALLNQYIHLTLARHSIFATAVCLAIDPYAGRVTWSNAGHPPAFRRGANGAVSPLSSTAMMLGPLPRHEYPCQQEVLELTPGDTLLCYTDGAVEARNRQGRQFGIEPLRQLLMQHPAPRHWSQFIASQVGRHAGGRSEDDVLVAAVTFLAHRREPVAAPTPRVGATA